MDSINRQQEEKNHEDLYSKEAIAKIKELVNKNTTCFFNTRILSDQNLSSRPMSVQKVDDWGDLLFLSASDSHKNQHIQENQKVQLLFQGSQYSDFLSVFGEATISTDPALIKELWDPMLKAWFTEGVDDPRITVLRVKPTEGYYWDNKHGNAVAFIKTAIGAAIGKTMDDSIEGHLFT
ncbi:MAG TPA: pyridoxamine 5'-phosphate oxidase family protein [Cyclobacteriaceae bacterium]|nr:pyridoxamine 5'-phosphate oxidase family protein [Cyclobacteriaceae bacterium]